MRKIFKPERVSGIVALSYLVLIPAAGFLAWRRVQTLEKNVEDALWQLNQIDIPGKVR
jgi:hypothetical protein